MVGFFQGHSRWLLPVASHSWLMCDCSAEEETQMSSLYFANTRPRTDRWPWFTCVSHQFLGLVSLASCVLHQQQRCSSQDPEGKPKKANIRDNRNGTYTVSYVPDLTGRYTITIKYGGDEIPYSPYRIHAAPTGDASKCLVTGQAPPTCSPSSFYSQISQSLLL